MPKKIYGSIVAAVTVLLASQQMAIAANLTVVQQDLPVGSNITVAGVKYQIMQFEIPAFDSDKIYLLKYPVPLSTIDPVNNYRITLTVNGSTTLAAPYLVNTINGNSTGLNGFKVFYGESYDYNTFYSFSSSKATLSNSLALSNSVEIQLDAKTYVTLRFAGKGASQRLSDTTHTSDFSSKLHASPTVMTRAQRNKSLIDLRNMFKYVIVKEKR